MFKAQPRLYFGPLFVQNGGALPGACLNARKALNMRLLTLQIQWRLQAQTRFISRR